MILEHYSPEPLGELYSVEQAYPNGYYDKPTGLWVSVRGEDDWYGWCNSNDFHLDRLSHCARVHLRPDARVLLVDSDEKILALEEVYGCETEIARITGKYLQGRRSVAIDWPAVATMYQGIIIAPYNFNARWDTSWYYTWDCASGCIWDATAIREIVYGST